MSNSVSLNQSICIIPLIFLKRFFFSLPFCYAKSINVSFRSTSVTLNAPFLVHVCNNVEVSSFLSKKIKMIFV